MPLDPKLNKFSTASPSIATYDYFDLEEGTGIRIYYGFQSEDSTGISHRLSAETIVYSSEVESTVAITGVGTATWIKLIDYDFDLTAFNTAKTLKGTGTIIVPTFNRETAGVVQLRVIAKLRKWDGVSETEVASVQSADKDEGLNMLALSLVIPETNYASGENARLTIEVWGYEAAAAQGTVTLGHDPQNRDGTNITPSTQQSTTKLIFHLPFKLET